MHKKVAWPRFGDRGAASKFKLDIVQNIPAGEPISYFKNGDFLDLCAGPHVMRTGNIGAFQAYTRGQCVLQGATSATRSSSASTARRSRTRPIMEGLLHDGSKRPSVATIARLARRWDCSKIDTELVGPGLPLWLPKGTVLVEELEKTGERNGIRRRIRFGVRTPHIAKEKLYLTSGHLPILYKRFPCFLPPMELKRISGR